MSFKFSLTYIGVLDEDFNFLPWLEKKIKMYFLKLKFVKMVKNVYTHTHTHTYGFSFPHSPFPFLSRLDTDTWAAWLVVWSQQQWCEQRSKVSESSDWRSFARHGDSTARPDTFEWVQSRCTPGNLVGKEGCCGNMGSGLHALVLTWCPWHMGWYLVGTDPL